MAKRKIYHVVPHSVDGWSVKYTEDVDEHYETKEEALSYAKGYAKNSILGQVKVHGRNGKIQTEYTYGKDPRKTKG